MSTREHLQNEYDDLSNKINAIKKELRVSINTLLNGKKVKKLANATNDDEYKGKLIEARRLATKRSYIKHKIYLMGLKDRLDVINKYTLEKHKIEKFLKDFQNDYGVKYKSNLIVNPLLFVHPEYLATKLNGVSPDILKESRKKARRLIQVNHILRTSNKE